MSDLIFRQDAIDALAKHEKSNGHNYSLFMDVVSECAEVVRDLPSAQLEQRWIPCSKEKPDDESQVLLQFAHNMAVGSYRTDEEVWCIASGDDWETPVLEGEGKPIAWMPLPMPYQKEGEK